MLTGRVASEAYYHHGNQSMDALITNMGQKFKNNMPVLDGIGQYGSLRSREAGASRYISTKLHPNFRLLYKDFELLENQIEEKQFHFWANATKLSYNLAQSFNLKDKQLDIFFQARIHKLMMHAFRSGKPSLKIKAMEMQQEMNIEGNRQIRICKILLFPGIWQMMRYIRSIIKSIKTQN